MTTLSFQEHAGIQTQFFTTLFNNPNAPLTSIKEFVEGFMTDSRHDVTFAILSQDQSVMARYTRLMYILMLAIYAETSSSPSFDFRIPRYFEKLCMNEPLCKNLLTQSMDIQFKETMYLILNVNEKIQNINVCHRYRIALTLIYLYYIRLYYQHAEFKSNNLVKEQNTLFLDSFYSKRIRPKQLSETTSMVHVQFLIVQFAIITFYLYTNFTVTYYTETDEECNEVQKAFITLCKVVEVDIAANAHENFKELVITVGHHCEQRYRLLKSIRRMGYTRNGYIRYLQSSGKKFMNQYFNMDCAYQYTNPIKKYINGRITYSEFFRRFVHFEDTFPFYSLHRFDVFRKKLNQLALGYSALGYYKGKVISFGTNVKNLIKAPFCTTWAIIIGIYNFISVNMGAACEDVAQAYSDFKVAGQRFKSPVPDHNIDQDYVLGSQFKDMMISSLSKPLFIIFYALRVVTYGIGKSFNTVGHTFITISQLFDSANRYMITKPTPKIPNVDKIAGRKVILRPLEKASRPAMLVVAHDRYGVEPQRVFHIHKLPVVVGNERDSKVAPTPDDLVGGKYTLRDVILSVDRNIENERILDIIRDAQNQTGGAGEAGEDIEEELKNFDPKDVKPIEDVSQSELEEYFYNNINEFDIKQNALSMSLGYHIQEIPEFIVNQMDIDMMVERCKNQQYYGPTFSDYIMTPLSIPNDKHCAVFIPAPSDDYASSGFFSLPMVEELEQVMTNMNFPVIVPNIVNDVTAQ